MNNEEIARKLEEFQEYLSISNVFTDIMRWLAWVSVKGLAWIVDALENLTDDILLIKTFYNNIEIVAFVDSIKPVLYIFLAFSLLFTGYLLIFNKKFNREGIVINIFIACIIILSLNAGMDKANEFTDVAIDAIKVETLYPNDDSTLSGSIIQRNVTDLTEIDKNNWSVTELSVPNSTSPSRIGNINIREKYGKDTEGISNEGQDISKYMLSLNNVGEYRADKLDQSGLEWNNEYYFRYSVNWFTIFVTLGIISFTLFSIALKLAKLFFELTFNYILALIVAPADIHDGQKTKKIIQAILNTFFATILIFLSMKVYMIGTAFLEDTLSTFPYLIALIAFSLAVVDGPNIVERLFGIDAGLKNGWGVLAGAYAGGRMATGLGKGIANMGKGDSDKGTGNSKSMSSNSGGTNEEKAPSPNDAEKESNKSKGGSGTANPNATASSNLDENKSPSPNDTENVSDESKEQGSTGNTSSVSQHAGEQTTGQKNKSKAPSPNDADSVVTASGTDGSSQSQTSNAQTTSGSDAMETANVTDNATVRTDSNVTGIQDNVQGSTTGSQTGTSGGGGVPQTPTNNQQGGTSNAQTTSSSQATETANVIDNATIRTDSNVTGTQDNVQGSKTGSQTGTSGGGVPQTPTNNQRGGTGNAQTTSSSQAMETARATNNSTVATDTEVANVVQEVSGNTSSSTTRTGGGTQAPTVRVNTGGANNVKDTTGSHTTETSKVTSNSTVTADTEISNATKEVAGTTTTHSSGTSTGSGKTQGSQPNQRRRPRNYSIDNGNEKMIDKMKNYKNK